MKRWVYEGTARAVKAGDDFELRGISNATVYKINDDVRGYIAKILGDRTEVYIRVNIWTDGSVDFFEEVDNQGSKVADLPPEEEDALHEAR